MLRGVLWHIIISRELENSAFPIDRYFHHSGPSEIVTWHAIVFMGLKQFRTILLL